jgi:hypothetical protein
LDPFLYLFDDYIWYLRTVNKALLKLNRDLLLRRKGNLVLYRVYSFIAFSRQIRSTKLCLQN